MEMSHGLVGLADSDHDFLVKRSCQKRWHYPNIWRSLPFSAGCYQCPCAEVEQLNLVLAGGGLLSHSGLWWDQRAGCFCELWHNKLEVRLCITHTCTVICRDHFKDVAFMGFHLSIPSLQVKHGSIQPILQVDTSQGPGVHEWEHRWKRGWTV